MRKTVTPTKYRQELKERILKTAMAEFKQRGVKAVKMDDIANKLSISKRTLYEVYANKEDLLLAGLRREVEEEDEAMHCFCEKPGLNVLEICIEFFHLKMRKLSAINPLFFSELYKYSRVVNFLQKKHERNDEHAKIIFARGIKEGVFRNDFDYDLMIRLNNTVMAYVMEEQLYKEYGMAGIFCNVVLLFMRGYCTLKGLEILDRSLERWPADTNYFAVNG
ncbi:TetR/AcrR family transcriptional regulator [Hoylesella pleuritidis]|uniref:Transcriptional regulator, TetR family n=1 Tax=Hoylesella pleuritidis F0068 TaxID=1081904 RepID=U2LFH8_9BACT|nr:TetR/AcrR family transcriptional regulator [Hoylesella pleuritidis]ERK03031.1 transcriptional regulator, TetR family [Hoylesella pleuritidis F0068]